MEIRSRHRTPPRFRLSLATLALGLLLGVAGCATAPAVRPVEPSVTYRWIQRSIPVSNEPSAGTLQVLRRHGLAGRWATDPAGAVSVLDHLERPTRATRYAALELSFYALRRVATASRAAGAPMALEVAARSWRLLFERSPGGPPLELDQYAPWALMMYDNAVARLVEALRAAPGGAGPRSFVLPMTGRPVTLQPASGGWSFDTFDDLLAVDRLSVKLFEDRFTRYGIGAPLVGFIPRTAAMPGAQLFPPKGLSVPVTAVLRFASSPSGPADGPIAAGLSLVDPQKVEWIGISGLHVPVAADFTAPLAALAGRGEEYIRRVGSQGMFSPGGTETVERLILMEPYDPDKIPVVMVHGLWSDPSIWLPLTNEIFGDPELRARYQVWYFMYPSGEPFLWSAARFRDALDELRRQLDPNGTERATHAMVLIGHSMGGLLVKSTAVDSGNALWNTIFTVPPERITLPPKERDALEDALFLKPKPYVRRIIFLSTPQHGARLAESLVGKVGSALIHLPHRFSSMLRSIVARDPEAVTPAMRRILQHGGADAVRALYPDNPVMETFSRLPIDPAIPFHSIIGDRGRSAGANATDGVVTRQSAHLPGATSEAIVPCDHHSTECPPAIAEVLRILRQPLRNDE